MEHATATYSTINHNRLFFIHSCKQLISMYIVVPKFCKKEKLVELHTDSVLSLSAVVDCDFKP